MTTTAPKKWTAEEIAHNIERKDNWLYHGLMAIYNKQTEDEKAHDLTHHENNVGFNGPDSNIMSRFAKAYQKYGVLYAQDKAECRKRLLKYCKQLAKIANGVIT